MIAELVYYDASLIIKLIITPNRVLLEEVLEKSCQGYSAVIVTTKFTEEVVYLFFRL